MPNLHRSLKTPAASLLALMLTLSACATIAADQFPLRSEFKDVPIISGTLFRKEFSQVTVIDVRSDFEYHILHIQGAINVSVSDPRFQQMIKEVRSATGKPLVFYCNGNTCRKSYMAGRQAQHALLKDSRTYDAGIATWARENPELTELLGAPLTNAERLISDAKLQQHLLSPKEFLAKVSDSLVMDIRTPLERAGLSLFVGRERSIPLHKRKKLDRFIQKSLDQERPLLAYDASGQEVRWLQYYLEEKGVTDYWFMRDGASGFFEYLKIAP